ncbi:MAG: Gfo/Idh/MocA family oxidoreductase [Planctomycetaceae bacterium]
METSETEHGRLGLLLLGGAQTHQENYARAFAADPRCRLIGLADEADVPLRRRALNLQLAAELGIPVFDDLDTALRRDDVQLVSVCVEPERRGRVAARCARAGKHVYIDKPLATTQQAAEQLQRAVDESGVCSQMFSLVRTAVARRAQARLQSGELGRLVGLHCELLFAKGHGGTADLAHIRREEAAAQRFTFIDSKRELFCVGLYPLVLFQWFTGERIQSVYASTSNYFFAEHQRNQVEDFSCLVLQMSGGIQATIMVGRSGWKSHPSGGLHQVHLVGTERSETLCAHEPRLEIACDAPDWSLPDLPHPEDPMGFWSSTQRAGGIGEKQNWYPVVSESPSDAAHFLDCITANQDSDVSVAVGARALEVILAAYRSAADHNTVILASD